MLWGTRRLVAACVGALMIGTPILTAAPADAHPIAPAASTGKPKTFIEALAALPAAAKALADTRAALQQVRVQRADVLTEAQSAQQRLDDATEVAMATHGAMVRAEVAASQAQADIDDAARSMYAAGGTLPSMVDVMLTADSELGLARSLVTRAYLDAVGDRLLSEQDRAARAREWVAVSASGAAARRADAAAEAAIAADALAAADAELAAAQADTNAARDRHRMLMRMTKVDRSSEYPRLKTCGDWLTRLLSRAGFEGEDLREAWAIVMRESGGRADAVSITNDLGLFQINTATWQGQPWFDRELLLTKRYNATIAHTLSQGGSSWYSWGLDGHGRPDAGAYVNAGWSQQRILDAIVMPYVQWYAQYPCRPADEKDLALGIPLRPLADEGKDPALQDGGGVRPDEVAPSAQPTAISG